MQFSVHGPFELPRNGHLVARTPTDRNHFWDQVDAAVDGLSNARGCYVFTVGVRAWYVGLAEKQTFRNECFRSHKITIYNESMQSIQGRPRLLFIPLMTNSGTFARRNNSKAIHMLENMLIGMAIQRNSDLMNVSQTKFLRQMCVPGVINTGPGQARSNSVQKLKKALGI